MIIVDNEVDNGTIALVYSYIYGYRKWRKMKISLSGENDLKPFSPLFP